MRALALCPLVVGLLGLPCPAAAKPHAHVAKRGGGKAHAAHGKTPTHPTGASVSGPPRPKRPAAPEIILTFDDGPSLERTPRVLDTLDAHGIKAVFFVNGWHWKGHGAAAERTRALLREMVRRGHAIGNHTVNHLFLCGKRGPKVAAAEITENADLIEEAIGTRPVLFRTPYGSRCPSLTATLAALHLRHTGWDIDPEDWKVDGKPGAGAHVRDFIIGQLRHLDRRAIILFHDVHQDTVEALPEVLAWIDRENAARAGRGEKPIKILGYDALLAPASPVGGAPAAAPPDGSPAAPTASPAEPSGHAALVPPLVVGLARALHAVLPARAPAPPL